ncbi:MAG: ClpXP protease specificity-enhancing factor SspB [Methylovirgula sp.]|nr:ClpXP protease specificity-enhancing factor SspB [Methylovirgula sp.]
MATDLIRYDLLVQDALRSVLRKVLAETARDGLPGNHHFVIAFRTDAPGVRLSPKLRKEFPHEMTIVLQHQFWNLTVTEQGFDVGLSFQGNPEILSVPFDAVTGFFDPSVEFGLKFEIATDAGEAAPPAAAAPSPSPRTAPPEKTKPRGSGSEPAEISPKPVPAAKAAASKAAAKPEAGETKPEEPAKVVSIDSFRKK